MPFEKDRLPDAKTYFESQGLKLGRGKKWVTTECAFHGGSDSMRINLETGAFVCMAGCGAKGGDLLAYEMAITGRNFVESAKALGAWVEDGKDFIRKRPTPFPARDALEILAFETLLVAGVASSLGQGYQLTNADKERLFEASARIQQIHGAFL
jgi:hypothetical protein